MKRETVALVGNPNSGKTTLFNRLTGSKQHVGNWPGVTIEKKEGVFHYEEHEITLVDLPGIYSLSTYSMEEVVSRDFIMNEHPDLIIDIVDGTNLERNLYLSMQLKELGLPMVIAVNMLDELAQKGITVDIDRLGRELNTPVVAISAKSGEGTQKLVHDLMENTYPSTFTYDEGTEKCLAEIRELIRPIEHDTTHEKFYDAKLLEDDVLFARELKMSPAQYQRLYEIQQEFCAARGQKDIDMAIADTRYEAIGRIIQECVHHPAETRSMSDRIDDILCNKYLGIPMFFVILFTMFAVTFGPFGEWLKSLIEILITWISSSTVAWMVSANVNPVVQDLVKTVFSGVGSVLSFMPQIMLLFLFLSVMEDSGYMSRAAFLMDAMLRKIGLNGKAFIPMLMGFGCSVPGIMASRVLENDEDRKMTMILTPFMSCGAKLPVYALLAGVFFPKQAGLAIFAMYVLGIVMAILCGFLLKKTVFKNSGSTFILELPPYRWPSLRNTAAHMWEKAKGFLIKAGTIILMCTVVLWALTSFTFTLQYTEDASLSIIAGIGKAIAWIFIPCGFGHWQSVISLISGFIAKESVVSSMAVLYTGGDVNALSVILPTIFSTRSAVAFMTFTLLYSPCVAAVATMRKESGSAAFTLKTILFQTGVAYVMAAVVYLIGGLF
jgi:ferrous iron transport protein B